MILHVCPSTGPASRPSFESVYRDYYQSILRYLYKHMGNLQDAEDLTAETFLYCYRNYERYDPAKSSVSTWLYMVTNSRLKNYYRDRRDHVDLSELQDFLFTDEPEMDRAVYLEQLRGMLAERLKKLPERQQEVVCMRFFQQKEFEDIAAALGTTPGNVRVMLSRALDKLKRDFSNIKEDWSI